ncbi:hypothetical protein BGL34_00055 [Fructilactobacillus lindneri]|nr:alpha/beta hydrolase [Fructilactobacillus lindneri]ANZ58417.1 hypothetical protein AYR60_06590 [Fructilactobacillus lindneri]ANZ59727.1 hypothetical protein AYR59_06780 [Fructilactobacillus lindneri]POG98478.1 hypothetical protein BGL31_00580 [Fructilactobacillus lindneri]POH03878.1 hypothetical protein BGL32_00585 [Fructilactobacillus lindneri]POH04878.1 hypothetical protein BGL33_01310 [Fructilactobacillus lindneri]
MRTKNFWSPTTLDYYTCLNKISPNYDFANFKRDDNNVLVLKKASEISGEVDQALVKYETSKQGGFVPGSKATKRMTNQNYSQTAKKTLAIRAAMGSENLDISFAVSETEIDLGDVILEKYEAENISSQSKPCFVYYHGGDFYGGSALNAKNFCKKLAADCRGIVFAVDYRLTPEVTATQLLADCQKAVTYVNQHADELKINRERIYVSGDSAGGNIAAVMSYLDAAHDVNLIKGQVLIYPMVDNREKAHQLELGEMPDDQKKLVRDMDAGNIDAIDILKDIYADSDNQMTDKTISPAAMSENEFAKMPRTMVIAAEFDCLNDQGYQYACSVAKHRNDTTYLYYGGMMHAFIDKVGIVPQSQDVIREMSLWAER